MSIGVAIAVVVRSCIEALTGSAKPSTLINFFSLGDVSLYFRPCGDTLENFLFQIFK